MESWVSKDFLRLERQTSRPCGKRLCYHNVPALSERKDADHIDFERCLFYRFAFSFLHFSLANGVRMKPTYWILKELNSNSRIAMCSRWNYTPDDPMRSVLPNNSPSLNLTSIQCVGFLGIKTAMSPITVVECMLLHTVTGSSNNGVTILCLYQLQNNVLSHSFSIQYPVCKSSSSSSGRPALSECS